MAGETISMSKLKQIFLLRNNGASLEGIARTVHSSRNTVKKYFRLAEQKGYSIDTLLDKEDQELEAIFAEPAHHTRDRYQDLEQFFPWMENELRRTGVTRWLVWGEYKSRFTGGYSYTQFCDYYKKWHENQSATMHIEHLPGDKMFIDYAGSKLEIVDRATGEIHPVEIYVALLGYSQKTYVQACLSQKKKDFISATENALHYFGGVPKALVPDNLKSAVTTADKYEAQINETFYDFANHYGTAIYPARSRKPKDKALVENAVNIVYKRVFAPLRDKMYLSIEELNQSIMELLEAHNDQRFQRENISRNQRFEQEEKATLQQLPQSKFEIKQYRTAKVMKNCHIQLEKHYYSVPYRYVGKPVKIVYTQSHIDIFFNNERVAYHLRNFKDFGYTTIPDHMSSSHQFVSEWTPEKFLLWAERISPIVKGYIQKILDQKLYPEQAYRSCVGILSYEKKAGKERLIKSVERAIYYNVYNYKVVKKIIDGKLDMLFDTEIKDPQVKIPFHENIRGAGSYK